MLQYTQSIRNICYSAVVRLQAEPFYDQVNEYSTLVITAQPEATGLHPGVNLHTVELSVHRAESLCHNQQFRQPSHLCVCQLPVNVILVEPQLSLDR